MKNARHRKNAFLVAVIAGIVLLPAFGCEDQSVGPSAGSNDMMLTRDSTPPVFDPARFVDEVDNRYFPLEPGAVYVYRSETEDGIEIVRDEVTHDKKVILGITATVVHDVVKLDGELVEETFDWYAQDIDGNVWYLGEDSKQFENGVVVGTAGSWEAGVDGAKAGTIMLARPKVGTQYYQEFLAGVAEDQAKVVSTSKEVRVPFGKFTHCLKTLDFTALEPDVREFKFYAPGVGLVLEVDPDTGVRSELIRARGLDDDHDDNDD
jgi:hypothetical protein